MGSLTVTFLGTGTSHGIPMIACDCPVCTSDDPRDQRSRPSILLSIGDRTVIVDTTPDFRRQCIDNNVRRLDAILFTHAHADHIFGLDDVRRFNALQDSPIDAYGGAATIDALGRIFGYARHRGRPKSRDRPDIRMCAIDGPFELFGQRVVPVDLIHKTQRILGYRVGDVAYCTDCSAIPDESWAKLEGLSVLILDALRITPHPAHFSLEEAIDAARRIDARRTYFTHVAHGIMHARESKVLPERMAFAYDGLRIEVD